MRAADPYGEDLLLPATIEIAEATPRQIAPVAHVVQLVISTEVRDQLGLRFGVLFPHVNERRQRLMSAAQARPHGDQ